MNRKNKRMSACQIEVPTRGFTLVEILIVIAVIGVLAAIAIPNFMRVRMNANEGAVRADLRTFSTSNESYRAFQNPPRYPPDMDTLVSQSYISNSWLNPDGKSGYGFAYAVADNRASYAIEANPSKPGATGISSYCIDQSGVLVRGAEVGLATTDGCVGGTPVGS